MCRMANTVPSLWSFLPCGIKKKGGGAAGWGRTERKVPWKQTCPPLPILFMIASFWSDFFGQFCYKGQHTWGKIQETINHWKMCLFHCLPVVFINVVRDQFSMNVDRVLNTSSCLFTNKTLKFWNAEFATLLVTFHLQGA